MTKVTPRRLLKCPSSEINMRGNHLSPASFPPQVSPISQHVVFNKDMLIHSILEPPILSPWPKNIAPWDTPFPSQWYALPGSNLGKMYYSSFKANFCNQKDSFINSSLKFFCWVLTVCQALFYELGIKRQKWFLFWSLYAKCPEMDNYESYM